MNTPRYSTPRVLLNRLYPIRKSHPGITINFVFAGSFLSVRIEDTAIGIKARDVFDIVDDARIALRDLIDESELRGSVGLLAGGYVCTWRRR